MGLDHDAMLAAYGEAADPDTIATDDGGPPRVTVTNETDAALVAIALEDKACDCYTQAENHDNENGRRFWQSRGDEFATLIGRIEVARW